MSHYVDMFKPPKSGIRCFLWKINQYGDVVVEGLNDTTDKIVDSGRNMVVMGRVDGTLWQELSNVIREATNGKRVLAKPPKLYNYGVDSIEQLVERLNAKGANKAKRAWAAIPFELHPREITWKFNGSKAEYLVVDATETKRTG